MSFGIVRIQKFTAGSVKGIEIHDRREKEGISHTNQDIDWERTSLNYDLHPAQNDNFRKAVNERISQLELKRAVRKDAIVMAQVLVTSDHNFFDNLSFERQKCFFQDSYEFLEKRYGIENIISATVHLDEYTPHMHVNFVPVTDDGRLSAKSLLDRNSLIEQQTSFFEQVGKRYELERGLQGGKKKHLEITELKALMAHQHALEASQKVETLEDKEKTLSTSVAALEGQIGALDDQLVQKRADLDTLRQEASGVAEFIRNAYGRIQDLKSEEGAFSIKIEGLQEQIEALEEKNELLDIAIEDKERALGGESITGKLAQAKIRAYEKNVLTAFYRLPEEEQARIMRGHSHNRGRSGPER